MCNSCRGSLKSKITLLLKENVEEKEKRFGIINNETTIEICNGEGTAFSERKQIDLPLSSRYHLHVTSTPLATQSA